MIIIKRDGREVDYNRSKIITAIQKANLEVPPEEKVTQEQIEEIVNYIESRNRKRFLVEDIQDIIEQKLMAEGKYVLAKTYIIYRYTRELVRKANTTDDSILSLIRNSNKDVMEENSNKNATVASTQRDLIAGEVSKDLTRRILLPEKISKAHEEGAIHFPDADYFVQPIFNCCLINIKDMLDNGTVMNGKLIESPKSFQVACTVMTQIISAVASSQYLSLIHILILFLSAIKDIPASYNEAATIDGASKWHIFRYITFPLIKQTSIFILITTTIASFQVLDLIMVMTKGGPAKATEVGALYIYDRSFNMMEMGYGSALSVFLFLCLLVFSFVQLRITSKE